MSTDLSKTSLQSRRVKAGALVVFLLAAWVGATACASQPHSRSPSAHRQAGARGWSVGIVVVDGVYNTELMAPYDVFEHTAHLEAAAPGLSVFTVSPNGAPITTAEGLTLTPDHGFATAPTIDVLVVPSAQGSRGADLENRYLIEFVRQRAEMAQLTMSLCWGAFVLAEAGVLEGHSATTFPEDYDTFTRRFPTVDLKVNVSFVHDAGVVTSQGGVLSYDAAMYVVDRLFGEGVAAGVGRGLLIPWPRASSLPPYISDLGFPAAATQR